MTTLLAIAGFAFLFAVAGLLRLRRGSCGGDCGACPVGTCPDGAGPEEGPRAEPRVLAEGARHWRSGTAADVPRPDGDETMHAVGERRRPPERRW